MLRREKHKAFKSDDKELSRTIKCNFDRAVKRAKRNYKCFLENKYKINDNDGVWKSLEKITGYKKISQVISDNAQLPDELNVFYSRFRNPIEGQGSQLTQYSWPCQMSTPFRIEEYEVGAMLRKENIRKAAGSDSLSSATLKCCAFILAPVLTDIFNWSLLECRVPACFKSDVIIPVPKKSNISC